MSEKFSRSKSIRIRVTEEEYSNIEQIANSIFLNMSDYMRMIAALSKSDKLKKRIKGVDKQIRNKAIQIRTTEEEYQFIKTKADNVSLTLSEYMRIVSITSKISIK